MVATPLQNLGNTDHRALELPRVRIVRFVCAFEGVASTSVNQSIFDQIGGSSGSCESGPFIHGHC